MKKALTHNAICCLIAATATVQGEGRPEVSICRPSDCQLVEDPLLERCQQSRELVGRLTKQNEIVMKNFDLLAAEVDNAYRKEKNLKAEEVRAIYAAIDFVAEKHKLQMRKNKKKTPYVSHLLGVAYNVMHYGEFKECPVIIGALLHDVIEDTKTSYEEIEKLFGFQPTAYVREVTDNKKLTYQERKRIQVIEAPTKSKGAAEIRLADKLYNVVDLIRELPEGWSPIRRERYFQWAESVVSRLPEGNEKLKTEIRTIINGYWEQQKLSKNS
jgi:(p)ppGpp synthase/HD superfamily hydrolase